ncbi:hypothetical protein DIZ76_017522 [Coccidioides immitis]|nr:hypothetical protein DIZ76_017522 [Coccidioides immitis]
MGLSERLRMLFMGADAHLLNADVGLNTDEEPPELACEAASNTTPAPALPIRPEPAMRGVTNQESDSDSEFEDEYLAALAASAKNKNKGKERAAKRVEATFENGRTENPEAASRQDIAEPRYYCPAVVISRFPYKYLKGDIADKVAKAVFDDGKFWDREWDLFYVFPPRSISPNPLLLIPQIQAQQLIDEINEKFHCGASIPAQVDMGVSLPFENDGTPLPQFLGRSTSLELKEKLERDIPPRRSRREDPKASLDAGDRSSAAFQIKMEAAFRALRRKPKASKPKKQRDQALKLQIGYRALKRLQCYLGLRGRIPRLSEQDSNDPVSLEEEGRAINAASFAAMKMMALLNVNEEAPFPFADEPIFISVDIESNEVAHSQIIEIGVSSLDTLDLIRLPPGKGGCNWMKKIKTRHFRISEYRHVRNQNFVIGCPDQFEFGDSEWISIKNAAAVLESCFRPPYLKNVPFHGAQAGGFDPQKFITSVEMSDDDEDGGVPLPTNYADTPAGPSDSRFTLVSAAVRRNVIFVGHDIASDIGYMRKLGCTIFKPSSSANAEGSTPVDRSPANDKPLFLDSLDTGLLFRILKRDMQPRALGKVLQDLDITAWNLHNAGNDAHYTMQALIGIAVKSRLEQDEFYSEDEEDSGEWDSDAAAAAIAAGGQAVRECDKRGSCEHGDTWRAVFERRVEAGMEKARDRVREEFEGWNEKLGFKGGWVFGEEDIDGGLPKGLCV